MQAYIFYLMAFTGGAFLAIQAGFNTQLGELLKQPVMAVVISSISSFIFGTIYLLLHNNEYSKIQFDSSIPWYLWFVGGLFSLLGISLYFYLIPKIGISKMIALGVSGQLTFALFAGYFGWLNLPTETLSVKNVIGAVALICGTILINSK